MKFLSVFLVACLAYNAECGRRVLKPLDKTANVDFINMEAGGGVRPAPGPVTKPSANNKQPSQPVNKASVNVVQPPTYQVAEPLKPQPTPAVAKVVTQPPHPARPPVQPAQPNKPAKTFPQGPQTQTTPGPGSVKQLITFYDSNGKASPIRPHSYSEAVKKGVH